ncbi:MAG: ABC transporter ATP-binding protein/permease [Lachnospiraceae bacterium]|nr:ABC transporter ATP-binding protein/permease [Lachnospiraceae bacterium]
MSKKVITIFRQLCSILTAGQKWLAVVVLLCSLMGALLETLGVSIISPLVSVLMDPEELMKASYVQKIGEFFSISDYSRMMYFIGGGVIALYLFKNVFFIFLSWVRSKYSCKVVRELSVEMMSSYMKRGYIFFTNHNTSELINGVIVDVGSVYLIIGNGLKIIVDLLTIALICVYMVIKDTKLALIVMVLAGVCLALVLKIFRKSMLTSGELYRKYNMEAQQTLLHAFQGIKDVIIFDKREFFQNEYNKNYTLQQQENVKRTIAGESPAYIIEGVCVCGLLLAVLGQAAVSDNPSGMVATLAAFAIGAFRILPSLGRISNEMNVVLYSIKGLKCVYENVREAREYENKRSVELEKGQKDGINQPDFQSELTIRNLSFAYPGQESDVLHQLNMTIPKGQSTAFIGQSGAGKTTLMDIILGLLEPKSGGVYFDETNIKQLDKAWHSIIGYVPQSVYLADDTIRFNVAFGEERANVDDEKVWKALEQAQLKKFVESLPKGLDTYVGEQGVRFSGGQRQRMAIARALYFDPQILVLDEATASLDTETESAVMQSVELLQGELTIIIVAHRLTTIRNCDVIYEIKDGSAVIRNKEELF